MHLISPQQLKRAIPLTETGAKTVSTSRETIQRIYDRQDPRLLLIVGPCSIHNPEEGLAYARQFKALAEEVKDSVFLVMRAYVEKPRTKMGWKGLVHDPHLNGSEELDTGLHLTRQFLVDLAEMGVPAATEFLTPHLAPYIEDLISWGCIGARTSSSQVHRLLASHLPMPVGFKNTVDGNISCAVNGVLFASYPHTFMHVNDEGHLRKCKSSGNPYCHVVLRGSLHGRNDDRGAIQSTLEDLRAHELPPRVLVDCSHGNSQGKFSLQKEVFQNVLEQWQEGNAQILGMMLESYLEAGSQTVPRNLADLQRGVSITDACLDYRETRELIMSVSSSMSMTLTQS